MSDTNTIPNATEAQRPIVIQAQPESEAKVVKEPRFEVTSHGQRIITADTFKDLHTGLLQAEELEEQVVNPSHSFRCYPLDGIVALNRALQQVFGFAHAMRRETLFGSRPPQILSVPTGVDQTTEVVFGKIAPPAYGGGWITAEINSQDPLSLTLAAEIKRKYEPSIKEVFSVAAQLLNSDSIYRGAACELNLDFIYQVQNGMPYDPVATAPKFIDVRKKVQLILPRDIEFELESIWGMMRQPDAFRVNGVPLKHGILLSGVFGTGKSLTSYITAQVAMSNRWTYLYLKTPQQFVDAYKLAQLYQPSVLFVEDIDAVIGGERDQEMNSILETLDGVGVKGAEVITIFTTNSPENINDAFLRSGRIDTHIQLRPLDGEAAGRFVRSVVADFAREDVDFAAVGDAFKDLVPADITEGVHKAKRRAIGQMGADIAGCVTTEMLVVAGEVVRRQRGLIASGQRPKSEVDLEAVRRGFRVIVGDGNGA